MPTALIIGASRGLGRALAEEHLKRNWRVIATVRDPASLADMTDDEKLRVETLDITDWAGIDALGRRLARETLDLLFVNAGVLLGRELPIGEVTPEQFGEQMLINTYAPLRLIERLGDLVADNGMIAVMSSGLGSVENNVGGGYELYRLSKAALNMGLKSLATRDAKARTWLAVAPGWVRTDMGGPEAGLSIKESIPRLTDMLERHRGARGVSFFDYKDDAVPW
jgi:NAD(P)-dependent dehydrogenase (short-subunit alcohol dehydrogenase family)